MSIAVDGDAFGSGEGSGAVAGFAEGADEVSVGIEDLDAVVEGIGDVDISFAVERNTLGRAEVAGGGEVMVLSSGADAAQEFEGIGVVDEDLVLLGIDGRGSDWTRRWLCRPDQRVHR